MEFPDTQITKDADKANYQNYLAWQARTAERKRSAQTQFNMYQSKHIERMCLQQQFKNEIVRELDSNKDAIERRLNMACDCDHCYRSKGRSNSDASSTTSASSSPTRSRSSISSDDLNTRSSRSPLGTTVRGSTSPSSKNSLVASQPPTSRHHQRSSRQPSPEQLL